MIDEEATKEAVEAGLDTVMLKSSIKETAEQIVDEHEIHTSLDTLNSLVAAIESALLAEREETERLFREIIPQILDEGNSESTVEWDFNSQFDDIRKLEREVFVSDVFCTLAERRDGKPRIHFATAIRSDEE